MSGGDSRDGDVPDPAACVESLHRVLQTGGLLSITETIGDPDALSREEAKALIEAKGIELVECFEDRAGFTLNFRARVR